MNATHKGLLIGWAGLATLVALTTSGGPLGYLLVVPFAIWGPGSVLARLVSPESRRFRSTVATISGLSLLVVVSEATAMMHRFDVGTITAVLAVVTAVGVTVCPPPVQRIPVLPPRPAIDLRSPAGARFGSSRIRATRPATVPAPSPSSVWAAPQPAVAPAFSIGRDDAAVEATAFDEPSAVDEVEALAELLVSSPTLGRRPPSGTRP